MRDVTSRIVFEPSLAVILEAQPCGLLAATHDEQPVITVAQLIPDFGRRSFRDDEPSRVEKVQVATANRSGGGKELLRDTTDALRNAVRIVEAATRCLEPVSKSSEEDNEAGELDKSQEVLGVVLPADQDAPLPLDPGEEALDQPSPRISA